MARRSAEQWARVVERWQRSGLTARAFAEREGLNPRTLSWWKWRLGSAKTRSEALSKPSSPQSASSGALVAVQVVGSEPHASETPVEIVVEERVIRVRRGFDEETLARVLDVLEAEDESC